MIDWNRVCPFCGGEMIGTNGHPICHYNPDCVIHDESIPQEILDKLETTRKALDVAVDALKEYANEEHWDFEHFYSLYTYDKAKEALEQITALEQKD